MNLYPQPRQQIIELGQLSLMLISPSREVPDCSAMGLITMYKSKMTPTEVTKQEMSFRICLIQAKSLVNEQPWEILRDVGSAE